MHIVNTTENNPICGLNSFLVLVSVSNTNKTKEQHASTKLSMLRVSYLKMLLVFNDSWKICLTSKS